MMHHFSLRLQNSEYPWIFRVMGANQNVRKLISTDLVNTNILYLNMIGFKAHSLWGCVQIKLIKSNLIKGRFLRRGENRSTQGKTSQSREENQQTQPTYDTNVRNRTRATLVGYECFYHYATIPTFCWFHSLHKSYLNWKLFGNKLIIACFKTTIKIMNHSYDFKSDHFI